MFNTLEIRSLFKGLNMNRCLRLKILALVNCLRSQSKSMAESALAAKSFQSGTVYYAVANP